MTWILGSWWRVLIVGSGILLFFFLLAARSCGGGASAEAESSEPAYPTIEIPEFTTEPPPAAEPPPTADSLPLDEPAPSADPTPTVVEIPAATEPEAVVDPLAVVAAEEFVRALLDTDAPDWPARAQSYVIPDRQAALDTIDPANLPEGSVQGSDVTYHGQTYVEVAVGIGDDAVVVVEVTDYLTRWYVRGWR